MRSPTNRRQRYSPFSISPTFYDHKSSGILYHSCIPTWHRRDFPIWSQCWSRRRRGHSNLSWWRICENTSDSPTPVSPTFALATSRKYHPNCRTIFVSLYLCIHRNLIYPVSQASAWRPASSYSRSQTALRKGAAICSFGRTLHLDPSRYRNPSNFRKLSVLLGSFIPGLWTSDYSLGCSGLLIDHWSTTWSDTWRYYFAKFDPLLSLLTFHHDNIRIFHKSLFDFLLDSCRSGNFRLDIGLVDETAANYIVRVKRLKDRWCECSCRKGTCPDILWLFRFHRIWGLCLSLPICESRWTDQIHIRSLARHPKITVRSSKLFEPSRSSLLQSMLNFLQVIGRQVSKHITMSVLQCG